MAEADPFFELIADCYARSAQVISSAIDPAPGSPASDARRLRDQYLISRLDVSLVDWLENAVALYLVVAADYARSLTTIAETPGLGVAGAGGALTRGCAEASGYACHLTAADASLHDRIG